MKRCPQCEVIYEDDQLLCDLDQFELVPDSLALVPIVKKQPNRLRTFAGIGVALVLIGMFVLGLLTLRLTLRSNSPSSPVLDLPSDDRTASAPHQTEPLESQSPSDEPNQSPADRPPPTARAKSAPVANPSKQETNRKPRLQTAQNPTQKKESKVESALKKTGRLLKKPFKF